MKADKNITPAEAFRYLQENGLPLIVSFQLEEERGHLVTGKGLCYIESIHGTSRVKLGKFTPHRAPYAIRKIGSFYATFDIEGRTYGCIMENITHNSPSLVTDIPVTISPFHRQFLRVEPSRKAPVILYLTAEQGTISHSIRDICERGIGFITDWVPGIAKKLICGINLPLDGGTFVLSPAVVVYTKENSVSKVTEGRVQGGRGISYGLQLFPHNEDEKKIRLYVMQRELEIRKKIQEQM